MERRDRQVNESIRAYDPTWSPGGVLATATMIDSMVGQVALVTGAGSELGIGFAAARRLGRAGAAVALVSTSDRIHARAAELVAEGITAIGLIADLTDEAQVTAAVAAAVDQLGPVDILVNNAGMVSVAAGSDAHGPFDQLTLAQWNDAMSRNLSTAFLVTKAVLPSMRARRYGRIVNVSSVSGPLVVFDNGSPYAAAKAGMVGMTRALALEVGHLGITVNAVAPGWINTAAAVDKEQRAGFATPVARPGTPDEVAACVGFLASPSASYVTGTMLVVDGGNSLVEDLNRRPPH